MKLNLTVRERRLTVAVSDCQTASIVVRAVSRFNSKARFTPQAAAASLFNVKTEGYEATLTRDSEQYNSDVSVAVLTAPSKSGPADAFWRVTVLADGNAYVYLLTEGADIAIDSDADYGATVDSCADRLAINVNGTALVEGCVHPRYRKGYEPAECEIVEAENTNVNKRQKTVWFGIYRTGRLLVDAAKNGVADWRLELPGIKATIPKGNLIEF